MQRPLGLTEDNALVILMAAHKLNAQRVVDMTRRFLMRRIKCIVLKKVFN